jgi:LysM repeat protein
MEKTRPSLFLYVTGLLVMMSLLAGCYRPASPDVTATPAAGAEAAQAEEGTPDIAATGIANATLAAQEAGETPAADTPTSPLPTPTPTTVPDTPVPTTPAPTALAPTVTPTVPAGTTSHTVQRGENLFRIALQYNTTVEAIASANGIANPALIYVGQVLTIPSPGGQPPSPTPTGTSYTVQVGDNLFRIALRYNLNYVYLAQYNGIANPSRIYVGQVLRIPPN